MSVRLKILPSYRFSTGIILEVPISNYNIYEEKFIQHPITHVADYILGFLT